MESTYFNKNYLIRYYPDSNDRHNNHLVGQRKMEELVAKRDVINSIYDRLQGCLGDKLEVRLRRGCMFQFVSK